MKNSETRKAAWQGQFYPGDPEKLREMIGNFIDASEDADIQGRIRGIIVPHAGYEYSGRTAAAAYRQLRNLDVDTVIVMAPSHAEPIEGVSVFNGSEYETPLGTVTVNRDLAAALCEKSDRLHLSAQGHSEYRERAEHSLEVQLPFLQVALKAPFDFVPIVFHDYSWQNCRELGQAIANVQDDRRVLLVASTDLYHGNDYSECVDTDTRTLQAIYNFDPETFIAGVNDYTYQACGAGPVAALQVAVQASGGGRVQILDRTNSADITGMRGGWTVGYVSALITE